MIARDPLLPTPPERAARARADMALGLPVAIRAADGATWLALAAGRAGGARLDALLGTGAAILALTSWRARTLKIRIYDDDLVRLPLDASTTPERIGALIDPANDLAHPMMGPFAPLRGGATDAHRTALRLARAAQILPAAILAPVDAAPDGVAWVAPDDLDAPGGENGAETVAARLPIAATRDARLHVFRPDAGGTEHYALEIGRIDRAAPVLVRLHSACFTGDVLGSLKCDCGAQLDAAIAQMAAGPGGVLLYLNQEGRGIGLGNKMRAYALQDQGFDTVEANHRLGFDDDERDFRVGASILKRLRIDRIRLLTNNPRKLATLRAAGIDVVDRVPLWVGRTELNADYLRVKTERSGHME